MEPAALDYARAVYGSVLGWYESADRKAQLILTIDGVFLSFLTGTLLSSPDDVAALVDGFGPETWTLLALMGVALLGSLGAALLCVISRLHTPDELHARLAAAGVRLDDGSTYPPSAMWFFQLLAELDPVQAERRLLTVDAEFATRAVANEVLQLAPRVRVKHRLVNIGFTLSVVTLVCFLAAGVSYVIRVA